MFHESSVALWAHALQIPIFGVNALSEPDEPINAPSGAVLPDGSRIPSVPDSGERFFTCELSLERHSPLASPGWLSIPSDRPVSMAGVLAE